MLALMIMIISHGFFKTIQLRIPSRSVNKTVWQTTYMSNNMPSVTALQRLASNLFYSFFQNFDKKVMIIVQKRLFKFILKPFSKFPKASEI